MLTGIAARMLTKGTMVPWQFALALPFVGAIGCSSAAVHPHTTSLCEVVANSSKFDHAAVQFSATIESDGIEHTALTSPTCPGKGMALAIPDKVAKQREVKKILDAIYRLGSIGTSGKDITATVAGVFLATPGEMPSRTLVLKSATNVHVSLRSKEQR